MAATAKGFLRDIQALSTQIEHRQWEIARLDSMLDATGYNPAHERTSGTRSHDRLAESIERLHDYREELAGLIDDYIALQKFADGVIKRLPDARHQQVIHLRYFERKDWQRIAKVMNYCETSVRNHHRAAIASLDAILAEARGEQ